jgi:hypothetical protein
MEMLEVLIEGTKSLPFRAKILERISKVEAEDDSRALVARATKILQRFPSLEEPSAVVQSSEPPVFAAMAVEKRSELARSDGLSGLEQARLLPDNAGPLKTGNDRAAEAIVSARTDQDTIPVRPTIRGALREITLRNLASYGIAPGFAAGVAVVVIISSQSETETPLVLCLQVGVLIAAATVSGYVWSARKSLPTLPSITSLVVFGLAMSVCEAAAISWLFASSWLSGLPEVIFRTFLLSVPFTLLGWGLSNGRGLLKRFRDLKG